MSRIALILWIHATCLCGASLAGDVIAMPLPVGQAHQSVAVVASRMIKAVSAPPVARTSMFNEGLDSLDRYASRGGQVRNHYDSTGYVPRSRFMRGFSAPYYSSYRGPRGWGWYGSPIIVNNYCPTFNGGSVGTACSRISFVGMGSF
ncbi:MAG: hypothetical protein P8J89_07920 [Phycisphaerales bacterium]|nr:hypothetical protein [Phycisphaerales bacterium]